MDPSLERRVALVERSNRRYRLALIVAGVALAGSVMVGLKDDEKELLTVNGFSAVYDAQGGLSYFRLVNKDTVQILDTSRGDRWYWRRIRNWPDHK